MTSDPDRAEPWSVRRIGCSPDSDDRLLALARSGRLAQARGDVVVVAHRGGGADETIVASSAVGARPYYWGLDAGGRLHHGDDVFSVARSAGLAWEWDPKGLLQLALMGHTVGATTLHRDVRRLGPDSTVEAAGGSVRHREGSFWSSLVFGGGAAGGDVGAFVEALAGAIGEEDPIVSLSAGFDSRALLAGALSAGARPSLLTMGGPESTDRLVATEIARRTGLALECVELEPRDYLGHAATIVRATSGTKLAGHWHTYLYARATEGHQGRHLVGSNGEFARTFYADLGAAALAYDRTGSPGARAQWRARVARWARGAPVPAPARGLDAAAALLPDLGAGTEGLAPLDALDRVYATQRVRHFVGNGLALYALSGDPASPFLDARWITAAAALPRGEKLGSRHHRRLIRTLSPLLAAIPIAGRPSVEARPPRAYWLRKPHEVGYSVFADVLALPETRERIVDASGIDELFSPQERRDALARGDRRAQELMLTLAVASDEARAVPGEGRGGN